MNSGSCMTSWPIKVHFRLGLLFCMNRVAHYSGTVAIRRTEKDDGCTFYHNSFRTEHGQLHIKSYFFFGGGGGWGGRRGRNQRPSIYIAYPRFEVY